MTPTPQTSPRPSRIRIAFVIPGKPVPLARHRSGRHGTYLPTSSRIYREAVQSAWLLAGRPQLGATEIAFAPRRRSPSGALVAVPAAESSANLVVASVPLMPVPIGAKMAFFGARANADLSNLVKGIEDALVGLCFLDDRQLVSLDALKLPTDEDGARAEVTFWEA